MSMLYLASLACNLGILSTGLFYGWSSPVLPLYNEPDSPMIINQDEAAWVAAVFPLGAAFGPILSAMLANKIGRKILMLISAIPSILSWIIIIFAKSPWELYASRFLSGIATGVAYAIMPLYLGEISPPKIRGFLLTSISIASRVGILFEYAVGPFVSIRTSAIISMTIPILFALSMIWPPESPYQLIRLGRRDAAEKSLKQMRSAESTTVSDELQIIEASVEAESNRSAGLRELFTSNRSALTISVTLVVIQQLSGSQAITAYSQSIFDKTNAAIEGKYLTIVLGAVQLISIGLCAVVVDRQGRRPLLLISAIGSCVATGLVAIYFNLQYVNIDTEHFEWLPAIGCTLFMIFYSLGLAGLPFTMIGELFPMNVKPLGSTIAIISCNVTSFVVTKSYQMIGDSAGVHVAFWIYTGCNLIGALYVYFCVPETRKKTLQEIQFALKGLKGGKAKVVSVNA